MVTNLPVSGLNMLMEIKLDFLDILPRGDENLSYTQYFCGCVAMLLMDLINKI